MGKALRGQSAAAYVSSRTSAPIYPPRTRRYLTHQAVRNELSLEGSLESLQSGNIDFDEVWDLLADIEGTVCHAHPHLARHHGEGRPTPPQQQQQQQAAPPTPQVLRQLFLVGGVRVRQVRHATSFPRH